MFGWLALLFGIVYGYITPGRQNKMELFKMAVVFGLVLGVVFALLAMFLSMDALGFGLGALGLVAILITAIVVAVFFVVGAWIGDFLEEKIPRKA